MMKIKLARLILDSRVLCDQQLNERRKQRFASLSGVVNKLEETQVQGEFLLGFSTVHFFLLNGDMELNKNRQIFVNKML